MKKIFYLVTVLLGCNGMLINAQAPHDGAVKWYTIQEAEQLEKTEPRKLIIDVYTSWCGWCKKMDQETFSQPTIAAYLNAHFYPVKFNAESSDSVVFMGKVYKNDNRGQHSTHQLAQALLQGKMSYPSIAYMDENMNMITTYPGYLTAIQIEPLLCYLVEDKFKAETYQVYLKTFVSKIK